MTCSAVCADCLLRLGIQVHSTGLLTSPEENKPQVTLTPLTTGLSQPLQLLAKAQLTGTSTAADQRSITGVV